MNTYSSHPSTKNAAATVSELEKATEVKMNLNASSAKVSRKTSLLAGLANQQIAAPKAIDELSENSFVLLPPGSKDTHAAIKRAREMKEIAEGVDYGFSPAAYQLSYEVGDAGFSIVSIPDGSTKVKSDLAPQPPTRISVEEAAAIYLRRIGDLLDSRPDSVVSATPTPRNEVSQSFSRVGSSSSSFTSLPLRTKTVKVDEVKTTPVESLMPPGFNFSQRVRVVYDELNSGLNMVAKKDYFDIAREVSEVVRDTDFAASGDKSRNEIRLYSKFCPVAKMNHPDVDEALRHLSFSYLKGLRKAIRQSYAVASIPTGMKQAPVKPTPLLSSPGPSVAGSVVNSHSYRLYTLTVIAPGLRRGLFAGPNWGLYSTTSALPEVLIDASGLASVDDSDYYESGSPFSGAGLPTMYKPGGQIKITAVVTGITPKNLFAAFSAQFALALYGRQTTSDNVNSYIEPKAVAVTDYHFPSNGVEGVEDTTPASRFKLVASLCFDPGLFPKGKALNNSDFSWAVRLGMIGQQAAGNYIDYTDHSPGAWVFTHDMANAVVGAPCGISARITFDYVPPATSLLLSGDVESNPGPMMAVVSDGIIAEVHKNVEVQNCIIQGVRRVMPQVVLNALMLGGPPSGPLIVEWHPDDSVSKRRDLPKPTGGIKPTSTVEAKRQVIKSVNSMAFEQGREIKEPPMNGDQWSSVTVPSAPVGITDKTPSTQLENVLTRMAKMISSDEDFVRWLIVRCPKISWACTVGAVCSLGSFGNLCLDFYRSKIDVHAWPSLLAAKRSDKYAFSAGIMLGMAKTGDSWAARVATCIDGLSNMERVSDPPKNIPIWKEWIASISSELCSKMVRDEQIEIPSAIRLMCVEPNPGPLNGFPAGRFPGAFGFNSTGYLRGGASMEEKYAGEAGPSDISTLVKLKVGSTNSWNATIVSAAYLASDAPPYGDGAYGSDMVSRRFIGNTSATSVLVRIPPPESIAQYRKGGPSGDSTQSVWFSAVGVLQNPDSPMRWSATLGAEDFLKQALGPVAARADRAIRAGFRYSDIMLWLNNIMTQSSGQYTISASSLPSSSYYINFLRVALACVPKFFLHPRFPTVGYFSGYDNDASTFVPGAVTLSYNDGLAAYGEDIKDFDHPVVLPEGGANTLSFWTSAVQAQTGLSTASLLGIPAALLSACSNQRQQSKMVALLVRMWAAHPQEFTFVNSNGYKAMTHSSTVVVKGGVSAMRLIVPLTQAVPVPEDAGDAAASAMWQPIWPDGIEVGFSVAAPVNIALSKWVSSWLVVTSAEDFMFFGSVMSTMLGCQSDFQSALHDATAQSCRYMIPTFVGIDPAHSRGATVYSDCGLRQPAGVIPDEKSLPLDPNSITTSWMGHQTDMNTFMLQVFGLISDNIPDKSVTQNYSSVGEVARYFRYGARCLALAYQCWAYLSDVTPYIWSESLNNANLSAYTTYFQKTCVSGAGKVTWPIIERVYQRAWQCLPPTDKLGLNMCRRGTYNPELDLALVRIADGATVDASAFFGHYTPMLLTNPLLTPAVRISRVFEPWIPQTDIKNAFLHAPKSCITSFQNFWFTDALPSVERMIAPVEPHNLQPFVTGDEVVTVNEYERRVSVLATFFLAGGFPPENASMTPATTIKSEVVNTCNTTYNFNPRFEYNNATNGMGLGNNPETRRCSYGIPKITVATNGTLTRVFWTLRLGYDLLPPLSGKTPYRVDAWVNFFQEIGDRVAIKSGGVKTSELAMEESSSNAAAPAKGDSNMKAADSPSV